MRKRSRGLSWLLRGLALVLLAGCASEPTTPVNNLWDRENQARIITSVGRASQCIAPVEVFEINGQTTQVGAEFFLPPGPAELGAFGRPNTGACPVVSVPPNLTLPRLEATFEAGKTYWIGLDHSASRARDWRYVVWREE